MTFIAAAAAAIGTGTLVSAGAALAGGAIAASGARDAARTQAGAADRATQAQREALDKQIALQEPWRQAGMTGLNSMLQGLGLAPNMSFTNPQANAAVMRLAQESARARAVQQVAAGWGVDPAALQANPAAMAEVERLTAPTQADTTAAHAQVGAGWNATPETNPLMRPFGMADYQADPGLAFRQQQGEQGLTRAAQAQGRLGSGKYLKDALAFNSGLASQEYGNAYNRFNANQSSQFNRLASLAGIGQTATNQTGAAAANFGQQIGSNIIGAGNAAAAGQVGSANAINNSIGQGLSMYQTNKMLERYPYPFYGGTPYNMGPATFGDYPMTGTFA